MRVRLGVAGLVALLVFGVALDALACGDKFLVTGRGTRYQRPKNARAASVLIYGDPATSVGAALTADRVGSALKHQGHRATVVRNLDQLSAILASGRFDVILTVSTVAANVQHLLAPVQDPAVVVVVDAQPKGRSLLESIDRAVEQRDRNLRHALASS